MDCAALPTGWSAVVSGHLALVVHADDTGELAAELRGIADSGQVSDALDLLLRLGTRKVPDFALVDQPTRRVLARGTGCAYVVGPGRSGVVQAGGQQLWADVDVDPDTDRILLYVENAPSTATGNGAVPAQVAEPAPAAPDVPPAVPERPSEVFAAPVDAAGEPGDAPAPAGTLNPVVAPRALAQEDGGSSYDHLFGVTERGLRESEGQVIAPVIGADGKAPGAEEDADSDQPASAGPADGAADGSDGPAAAGHGADGCDLTLPPPTETSAGWPAQKAGQPAAPAAGKDQAPRLIDAVPWAPTRSPARAGDRAGDLVEPDQPRPTLPPDVPVPDWAQLPTPGTEQSQTPGQHERPGPALRAPSATPRDTGAQPHTPRDTGAQPHTPRDPSAPPTTPHEPAEVPDRSVGSPGGQSEAGARTRSAPAVLAVRCPRGHPSPPHAGACIACGADIADQEPALVPRPQLGVLRLSTGDLVPLDRNVVLGRAPRLEHNQDPASRPHLVRVPSPENDISRKHVEVVLDGWHVLVRDLGSTNGTCVTLPGSEPVRLRAHDDQVIEPGTMVTLADEVMFTYELGDRGAPDWPDGPDEPDGPSPAAGGPARPDQHGQGQS